MLKALPGASRGENNIVSSSEMQRVAFRVA